MSTILVAPDKFKGSLSAVEVAAAIRKGIGEVCPGDDVVCVPVADGGDGTLDAVVAAGYDRVWVEATGPSGELVQTSFARCGATAVVELADAAGLSRLPGGRPLPMTASSRGVGDVLAAAIEQGCRHIVLGIGGSASTDGGVGMLQALGVRILDDSGNDLPPGGAALSKACRLDLTGAIALDGINITVACDVDNPLLGERGAAAVYGPQKGADPDQVRQLDAALEHWADLVATTTPRDFRGAPGAGAAGGVGFAALALLGAQMRPGIDVVLELIGFESHLLGASLVVTGEGRLDGQSLHGKTPVGIAQVAIARGIDVVAVCGQNLLSTEQMAKVGISRAYALTDLEPDLRTCTANAADLLIQCGSRIGDEYLRKENS